MINSNKQKLQIKKKKYNNNNFVYVQSTVDDNFYRVRDLEDKQIASDMLAKIKKNILTLTTYLYENKEDYPEFEPYIEQLNNKIKNVVVVESPENSIYTSYSVNKGEQIVFCLRSRKVKNKLYQLNLLMYVVLHEMAHVACPEYNHTPLFKKIFAFLTIMAIRLGLYHKIDFYNNPVEYCGLLITDSII